jgi:ribonuclease HI
MRPEDGLNRAGTRGNRMHKVTIYTDGACSHNPGGDGAFAAILIHPKKTLCISGYIPAPTTNNRAEWAAIIEAIAKLTAPCEVVVCSDSMICVDAINGRGKKDAKRGNRDLVFRFREVARPHQISAVFVRGHAGDRHNEACDMAATTALREKTSSYPAYCLKPKEPEPRLL